MPPQWFSRAGKLNHWSNLHQFHYCISCLSTVMVPSLLQSHPPMSRLPVFASSPFWLQDPFTPRRYFHGTHMLYSNPSPYHSNLIVLVEVTDWVLSNAIPKEPTSYHTLYPWIIWVCELINKWSGGMISYIFLFLTLLQLKHISQKSRSWRLNILVDQISLTHSFKCKPQC